VEHVLSLTSEGKDELRRRLREADGAQISDENHWFTVLAFLRHLDKTLKALATRLPLPAKPARRRSDERARATRAGRLAGVARLPVTVRPSVLAAMPRANVRGIIDFAATAYGDWPGRYR